MSDLFGGLVLQVSDLHFALHGSLCQQGEVRPADLPVTSGGIGVRTDKPALVQADAYQFEPVVLPYQDLLRPRVLPSENEDALALEGTQTHLRADYTAQAVDALAHVHLLAVQVDPVLVGYREHGYDSILRTMDRMSSNLSARP